MWKPEELMEVFSTPSLLTQLKADPSKVKKNDGTEVTPEKSMMTIKVIDHDEKENSITHLNTIRIQWNNTLTEVNIIAGDKTYAKVIPKYDFIKEKTLN